MEACYAKYRNSESYLQLIISMIVRDHGSTAVMTDALTI